MINEPLDIKLLLSPFLKFVQKRVDERINNYREDVSKDCIVLSDLFNDIYCSLTAHRGPFTEFQVKLSFPQNSRIIIRNQIIYVNEFSPHIEASWINHFNCPNESSFQFIGDPDRPGKGIDLEYVKDGELTTQFDVLKDEWFSGSIIMRLNHLNEGYWTDNLRTFVNSDIGIWDLLLEQKERIVPLSHLPMPPSSLFTHATFLLDEGIGDNISMPYESFNKITETTTLNPEL